MSVGTLLGAVVQLVLLCGVGWGVGNLVLDRVVGGEEPELVGPPERALAAVAGAVLFSVGLMAVHIITGGVIFGVALVVPLIAVATLVACRRHLVLGGGVPWLKATAAVALLCSIYLAPALAGGSSIRTGDPPWHLGWTEQLLAGDPVPTGPAPEFGRNAYPWGLHAVMGTAVRLVPGTTPLVSLEMLHLLLIVSLPLAAACLARRLRPEAGWFAAAAGSLIGGFGWIVADRPDFVTSPGNARYGADLVVASPNSVYELFPPALPRELGLVMLAVAAWMLFAAAASRRHNVWAAAGATVGLVGVLSVPLFVTALVWTIAAGLAVEGRHRWRWFGVVGLAAVAVFALWAGPVASNAVRFGGFVNITPRLGKEWLLPVALASWGLLLPLAIVGLVLVYRSRARHGSASTHPSTTEPSSSTNPTSSLHQPQSPREQQAPDQQPAFNPHAPPDQHSPAGQVQSRREVQSATKSTMSAEPTIPAEPTTPKETFNVGNGAVLLLFAVSSAVLLGLAVVRGRLDWDLAGNATLLHQGRMWPPAHLLGAVFAGLALMWLYEQVRRRSRLLAVGGSAVVLALGAASPVMASQRLGEIMGRGSAGYQYGGDDLAPDGFARRAAAYLGPDEIVEVRGSDELAFLLFQLSGTRIATYDDPRLDGNDLRIRYAELAARYDETMRTHGFTATYMVLPAPEGPYDRALVHGSFRDQDWILIQMND